MDWNFQLTVVGEVALAMLLGGIIGLEREVADKPAGLRTHILVAGASALLVGLSAALVVRFPDDPSARINVDPVRVVQSIILGISFLGAGTIVRQADSGGVQGLTTAASILMAGAIGISTALRQWVIAGAITLLTLLVLVGLNRVDSWRAQRTSSEHPSPREK